MEYILINDSKLKVICEKCDLAPYGISADTLEYGDASARKFIEETLKKAKNDLGFETERHRILIQLFPSSDGGCEIFISKLGAIESEDTRKIEVSQKPLTKKRLYFFEKLDYLIEVCKRLSFLPPCKISSAYYLDSLGYYLYFETEDSDGLSAHGIDTLDEYSFILEYGDPKSVKLELPMLCEYARSLCAECAVEALCKI
ncbi:MAG: adaptor protein MecA [Clostridia bacterium]|nr:adaptor protein MecA [Clostridia bacterium]